jgi:hypothetical protein
MVALTLQIFDLKLLIQIEIDALDIVIGACLTQEHNKQQYPLAYYLRKITPAELNYDIYDKELLAIVASL